jgi:hypothetical protein
MIPAVVERSSDLFLCVRVRCFSWFVERLDYLGGIWIGVLDMSMKTVLHVRLKVTGV